MKSSVASSLYLTNYVFYICSRDAYRADPWTNDVLEYRVTASAGLDASSLYWWLQSHPTLSRHYNLHAENMILAVIDTSTGEILWTATPRDAATVVST